MSCIYSSGSCLEAQAQRQRWGRGGVGWGGRGGGGNGRGGGVEGGGGGGARGGEEACVRVLGGGQAKNW